MSLQLLEARRVQSGKWKWKRERNFKSIFAFVLRLYRFNDKTKLNIVGECRKGKNFFEQIQIKRIEGNLVFPCNKVSFLSMVFFGLTENSLDEDFFFAAFELVSENCEFIEYTHTSHIFERGNIFRAFSRFARSLLRPLIYVRVDESTVKQRRTMKNTIKIRQIEQRNSAQYFYDFTSLTMQLCRVGFSRFAAFDREIQVDN